MFPISALIFFMLPLSCSTSALLAVLTSLSWPSGPHPWLWLLTTSPTELQIGWHTMPRSSFTNTMHSPAVHLPFSLTLSPNPVCPFPHFSFPLIHSLHSFRFLKLTPSISLAAVTMLFLATWWWLVGWQQQTVSRLIPVQGSMSRDEPELTMPLPSETKVVCSIIQTGATPTAASATLTLTNGQKNRWFVHSWPV